MNSHDFIMILPNIYVHSMEHNNPMHENRYFQKYTFNVRKIIFSETGLQTKILKHILLSMKIG